MSQLAERYALALFEVVKKKGSTDTILETLTSLKQSLVSNPDVVEVLATPLISATDKLGIIKSAVGDSSTEELSTFFELVSKNNRLSKLPEIIDTFEIVVAKDQGTETGTVKSATELSEAEKSDVTAFIEKELGKKVTLQFQVDSTMLGGIEAKVGSYIFEDNIKSHMKKLNDLITRRVQ